MAASAWAVYDRAKEFIGDNTIDLDLASEFRLHFFTSGSNAQTSALSTLASVTNQLASGNGYTQSGYLLTQTWGTGASAGAIRFDTDDVVLSASGGAHNNVQYAAIVAQTGASAKDGTNKLLCACQLSTASIDVGDGSTLTVQQPALGVFNMT